MFTTVSAVRPAHAGGRAVRCLAVSLYLALVSACGGGSDTPAGPVTPPPTPPPPSTPAPVPAFTLTVGAITPGSVRQGDSASATITVTRTGGFTGAISLFVDSAPSALTTTLALAALPEGVTSTTIRLTASRATPPGTYPINLRAEAPGMTSRSASLSLVVTLRPATMSMVRNGTTPLIKPAGGTPIAFDVILDREEVAGDVTFDVASGLPPGMTASFSPAVTRSGLSRVSLASDTSVVPGSYVVVLRASAAGVEPATVSVPFTVTARATLALLLSAPGLSVVQNGSGGVTVTIVRTNTTENFTLDASGQPPGAVVSFEQLPFTGGNQRYTVRFTIGSAAVPGTYPIVITATVPSAGTATATIDLTVTATPVGGALSFRFCGEPAAIPIWFGHGTSTGNWTRVMPDADNVFSFTAIGRNIDLAWVTQQGPDDFRITVLKGDDAERAAFAAQSCLPTSGRSVTGTMAGLAAGDEARIAFGPRVPASTPSFAAPGFTIVNLPDGPLDLLAARSRFNAAASSWEIDRLLIQRAQNPASGASLGALDFAGASAIVPELYTLSASGSPAGAVITTAASFHSAGGASIALGSSASFAAVPASHRIAGDLHALTATSVHGGTGSSETRTVSQLRASPGNTTLAFGGPAPQPEITLFQSDGFFARFQARFLELAEYDRLYVVSFTQQQGATRREQVIIGTATRTATLGADRRVLASPFTGASGWSPAWEPRVQLSTQWLVSAMGWDAAGGTVAPRADGVVTRGYVITGTLPPQ